MTKTKHQQLASWIVGGIHFSFLTVAFWCSPHTLPLHKQNVLALVSAILAGVAGYFITGNLKVVANCQPRESLKLVIQAGGGAAFFVLVLLCWTTDKPPAKPIGDTRKEMITAYTDQIMDNLIRVKQGQLVMHFDFDGSEARIASTVHDKAVYKAYLDFVSIPNRLMETSEPPAEGSSLVTREDTGKHYWIPLSARSAYFDLTWKTTSVRGPKVPDAGELVFHNRITGVSRMGESFDLLVQFSDLMPNDNGRMKVDVDGKSYCLGLFGNKQIASGTLTTEFLCSTTRSPIAQEGLFAFRGGEEYQLKASEDVATRLLGRRVQVVTDFYKPSQDGITDVQHADVLKVDDAEIRILRDKLSKRDQMIERLKRYVPHQIEPPDLLPKPVPSLPTGR